MGPRICIPKSLPAEHAVGAALRAMAHNPENVPEIHPPHLGLLHPLEIASVTSKRWKPGSTITVGFLGGSAQTRARVLKHMRRWSEVCNILFALADTSVAQVRIAFEPGLGSWSYIGTDVLSIDRGEPTMNLGWIDDDTPETEVRRVVVHETGHTLSFEHEAQLGEALGTVVFNKPAVYQWFTGPPNNWTQAEVDQQILTPLDLAGVEHSDWDKRSIMEYFFESSWLIPPTDIPQTTDLSPIDIDRAAAWYPRSGGSGPGTVAPDFGVSVDDPLFPIWQGNVKLLAAVNAARAAHRLPALGFSPPGGGVASLQCRRCAAVGTLTHARPSGDVVSEYCAYGLDVLLADLRPGVTVGVGECLFAERAWPDPSLAPTAASVVAAWLADPPHRAVVLASRPTHAGFGWVYGSDGTLYLGGGFGKPI